MRIASEALAPAARSLPAPIARPKLALWLWERGIDVREAGELFECSHTSIQNFCKPFDDPTRRVPKPHQMERIVLMTRGEITPPDFYPPHLNGSQGAPQAANEAAPDLPANGTEP